MLEELKKLLPHPLSVQRQDRGFGWRYRHNTGYVVKIKNTGYNKPKDSYIKQIFKQSLIEYKGVDNGYWTFLDTKSEDPKEIANAIIKWYNSRINNIPLHIILLFDILSQLKDVKYDWGLSPLVGGFQKLLVVSKSKMIDKKQYHSKFTIYWNDEESLFKINKFRGSHFDRLFPIAKPGYEEEIIKMIKSIFKEASYYLL